jgi:hypothetical protein
MAGADGARHDHLGPLINFGTVSRIKVERRTSRRYPLGRNGTSIGTRRR